MATYIASGFTVVGDALTNASDVVEISGSATKIVTVHEMSLGVTTIQAVSLTIGFIKRSSAGSGSPFLSPTILKHQPSSPAPTAVVKLWNGEPIVGVEEGAIEYDFADHLGATVAPPTKARYVSNVPGTPGILLSGTSEFMVAGIVSNTTPFSIGVLVTVIWSED